jgi:hypothetical protein
MRGTDYYVVGAGYRDDEIVFVDVITDLSNLFETPQRMSRSWMVDHLRGRTDDAASVPQRTFRTAPTSTGAGGEKQYVEGAAVALVALPSGVFVKAVRTTQAPGDDLGEVPKTIVEGSASRLQIRDRW